MNSARCLLLGALVALGCSRSATMHIVHPSPLSRWGREIGVSRIENEGDADLTGMITRGLSASPALVVVPAAQQRMRVVGRLEQSVIEPERLSSHPSTCTRMVPEQHTVPVPTYSGNPPRMVRCETDVPSAPSAHPSHRVFADSPRS